MGGANLHSIESLPEPGHVIWCKFPLRERPGVAGPWARPTLVLATAVHKKDDIVFGSVWVAYGTDLGGARNRPHLAVSPMKRARQLGLHKPTGFCFDAGSVKHLLWSVEYFIPPDYLARSGLVIGQLDEAEMEIARRLAHPFIGG
jgi:hypothetical protein